MAEERPIAAYVQAPDKVPLMPCHSYGRVKSTGELVVMRGQHNGGERIYQAYSGLAPLKSYAHSLKKKAGDLKREKKEGSPEYVNDS